MSTDYALVTGVIRSERLLQVERAVQDLGVSGVSVSRVKGYGEYADFFTSDWMSTHVRIEVITAADRAEAIVDCILEAASSGTRGDGIVTLTPIESVWRIRTCAGAAIRALNVAVTFPVKPNRDHRSGATRSLIQLTYGY